MTGLKKSKIEMNQCALTLYQEWVHLFPGSRFRTSPFFGYFPTEYRSNPVTSYMNSMPDNVPGKVIGIGGGSVFSSYNEFRIIALVNQGLSKLFLRVLVNLKHAISHQFTCSCSLD
jgi:hypothetical protein